MKEYQKSKLNRVKRGQNRAIYDQEVIHNILNNNFLCYVGYVYDGYPISIPMAYGFDGEKIYLHGSQGNRLLNSLLASKKTSITIMQLDGLVLARSGLHHSVNYHSATLFGDLKTITSDPLKEQAIKCVMDQMMIGRWDGIRPMHQEELDRTLVVELTIHTASAKIRDTGVNDEPEDYDLDIWAGIVPIKQIAGEPISDDPLKEGVETPRHVTEYYERHKS